MSEDRTTYTTTTTTDAPPVAAAPATTTVIERRGGGGTALLAVVLLIGVLVGAWYLFGRQGAENRKDAAITSAAKSVGGAADKLGDAVSGK
jgi:uncharacterized protein HemX